MNYEHECNQGRNKCECEVAQDLPCNRWTLLAAVVAIALAAFISSLAPWGFA